MITAVDGSNHITLVYYLARYKYNNFYYNDYNDCMYKIANIVL